MFKHVTIHLSGPICKCATENLSWGVHVDAPPAVLSAAAPTAAMALVVTCNTCRTQLKVPQPEFTATFALATPYTQPRGVLHLVPSNSDDN